LAAAENSIYMLATRSDAAETPVIVGFNSITTSMVAGRRLTDYAGASVGTGKFLVTVSDSEAVEPGAGSGATFFIELGGATTSLLSGSSSASDVASAIAELPTRPDDGSLSVISLPATTGANTWEVRYRHAALGNLSYTAAMDGFEISLSVSVVHLSTPDPAPPAIAATRVPLLPTLTDALPAVVASLPPGGQPFPEIRAQAGPVLAAGVQWVAVGHPTALLNESGLVVLRHRDTDGSLGPAGLLLPIVPEEVLTSYQGLHNITAAVRTGIPWLYDVPSDPAAPLLDLDTASDGLTALRMPRATDVVGPRFGSAIAVDGAWMVVGSPDFGVVPETGPIATIGFFTVLALSPDPASKAPRAVVSAGGTVPDSLNSTGARSGPHPAAPTLQGLQSQNTTCGATVAIGGGFIAVGCPGLSLPATRWTPAVEGAGGILVLRKSRPSDTVALAQGWPVTVPESATTLLDLRADAAATRRPAGQPLRAEALVKTAAWPTVQLLVPTEATQLMGLGSGRPTAPFLAVSSRFLAAAVPGSLDVFVWRRRNGMAPAFDPASQQTLRLSRQPTGIALLGSRLVVSLQPAPGSDPAEIFSADALGSFSVRPIPVAGTVPDQPRPFVAAAFGAPADLPGCSDAAGQGLGASVAVALPTDDPYEESLNPKIRLVTNCLAPGTPGSSTPVVAALVDFYSSCPSFLGKPAAPALSASTSVASARGIYSRSPEDHEESSPGECDSVTPRHAGTAPFADAFQATANSTAPVLTLGSGPATACVLACAYGHSLASGSQLTTCEAEGAWSLLPDEVPLCERLFAASPLLPAVALGRRLPTTTEAGQPGPLESPGMPGFRGGDDPDAVPFFALHLSPVPPVPGAHPAGTVSVAAADLDAANTDPVSLLHTYQALPGPAIPGAYPAATLRAVLGASRAVDGTYSVSRAASGQSPVLAFQSRAAARGPNGTFPVVVEASGGASPAGSAAHGGHFASAAAAARRGILVRVASSRLPAVPARPPSTRLRAQNPTPVLATALEAVSVSVLVPRAVLSAVARERFEPTTGSRHDASRCAAEGVCAQAVSDELGVRLRPNHERLGPATDPLARWSDPVGALDPLRGPRYRPAPELLLPGRRPNAQRSAEPGPHNASNPMWLAPITTAADLGAGSPDSLALPGAATAALLRFSPANASVSGALDGPSHAGHLLLDDSDLLGAEALLAPMTWHGAIVDLNVALQARGGPALGGTALSTTLPVRICCGTGRGREPYDLRRRTVGPLVTTVRVFVTDSSPAALNGTLAGPFGVSFVDTVLARLALRLGNVSAAASLLGRGANIVPEPQGSVVTGGLGPTVLAQRAGAGTAALDVPGAYAVLASSVVEAGDRHPLGAAPAASATVNAVTGRALPTATGATFDVVVSGFGAPDATDRSGACFPLESAAPSSPDPASSDTPSQERTALLRTLLGTSRAGTSATLTLRDADRLAKAILRAAGQPLTWFERRRCVAVDRRSVPEAVYRY